ncbi:amino acid transporter [Bryobacterales bacterium F-183]|nr:amino acid transporter [Bryobacterales bacterium F-183]
MGMSQATLLAFSMVALITIVTPGPTMLLTLSNGSRFGVRRAFAGMLGAIAADFVLIATVAAGLGALLAASQHAFSVLKWVGVLYLCYLGWKMLRSDASLQDRLPEGGEAMQISGWTLFRKCFLVGITNPKGYLFFTAFLPQFLSPGMPQAPQYAILAVVFASIDLLVMCAYAQLGSKAMGLLREKGTVWLDRTCGAALLALAASLALYRRRPA